MASLFLSDAAGRHAGYPFRVLDARTGPDSFGEQGRRRGPHGGGQGRLGCPAFNASHAASVFGQNEEVAILGDPAPSEPVLSLTDGRGDTPDSSGLGRQSLNSPDPTQSASPDSGEGYGRRASCAAMIRSISRSSSDSGGAAAFSRSFACMTESRRISSMSCEAWNGPATPFTFELS